MRNLEKEFIGPDDMAMLDRVMRKLLPANADAAEREWLASLLLQAFQAGTTDEAALTARVGKSKRP
ncbi:MAG: hypothetical protein EOS63_05490 [Mesorhizobium sp.]|uniref:hypothetical protein n=1 Tax=Mesorhizobium sp. TaxID=1871066 RepID=UPI000FE88637|nr:hypothetical protein [Mesorhizobium sp.]RWE83142.1 MAG: hypothetical protein EOS63_05490 [Mesorhizobium sp.]TIU44234.1 MAG: hypothetical protein E5W31_01500 [Mesorhizobium sp.]TJW60700.1 MAG: hypothetical protein E5V97_23240 [Mesorhizobium sp.]